MDTEQNQNVKRIPLNIPLSEEPLLDTDKNSSKKLIVLTNSDKKSEIKNIQQKEKELQQLREKLVMANTQQNSQTNVQKSLQQNQLNQSNQQQMQVPPMVQKMMMARQNANKDDTSLYEQHFGLAQNGVISNKITNLQAQTNYMDELEKIKKLRYEEEKRLKELREKIEKDYGNTPWGKRMFDDLFRWL